MNDPHFLLDPILCGRDAKVSKAKHSTLHPRVLTFPWGDREEVDMPVSSAAMVLQRQTQQEREGGLVLWEWGLASLDLLTVLKTL